MGDPTSRVRVLVADDEPAIREVCRSVLESEGFLVRLAATGTEAIQALDGETVDAVLTDVRMPGASGLEVLREVRARSPEVPVILITAFASVDVALEALRLGANDMLLKPVEDLRLIPLAVRRGLAWRDLLRRVHALERVNSEKDAFLSIVGHELRTPLTVLQGALAGMGREGAPEDEGLAMCRESVERLTRAVEDIFLLRGLLSGDTRSEPRPIAVSEMVAAAIEACRTLATRRGVLMDAAVDPPGAVAEVDPELLQPALVQLLRNAVAFGRERGRVALRAVLGGGRLRLAVEDEGEGIPEGLRPVIFAPFSQAANPMTREVGGMGLGLPIVQAVAAAHGGNVEVESEVGRGSRFTLSLPQGE
ncbi:MAG: hybrid sensor histidine kinase/response regulator [Planctomycetes bacterium]|nr:hybrid sensor histidine kinase/response regulator [Planctomycetota bacterium]